MTNIKILICILIFTVSVSFWSINLDRPFFGHHDWNSNLWMLTVKNQLNYGVSCTRLGQVVSTSPNLDCKDLSFYINHPPLLPWLLSLSGYLFGVSETTMRLPVILLSSISSILFFWLASRNHLLTGIAAVFLSFTTPIWAYYGKMPNHEALLIFGILVSTLAFVYWWKFPTKAKYLLFLASTALVGLSGWHGYLLYPWLLLLTLLLDKARAKYLTLPIVILMLIFAAHQLHSCSLRPDCLGTFAEQLKFRVYGGSLLESGVDFSYAAFVRQQLTFVSAFLGKPVLLSACVYLLINAYKILKTKTIKLEEGVVWALVLFGVSVPAIFAQQAFIHDYLNIFLFPGICLAASYLLQMIFQRNLIFWIMATVFLVVVNNTSTIAFTKALNERQASLPYYRLAQVITKSFSPEDKILMISENYRNHSYPLLENYTYGFTLDNSSYTLDTFTQDQAGIEEKYDYLLVIPTHISDSTLLNYLNESYELKLLDSYLFYQLGD